MTRGADFSNRTEKALIIKENWAKWDFIKIKNICSSESIIGGRSPARSGEMLELTGDVRSLDQGERRPT